MGSFVSNPFKELGVPDNSERDVCKVAYKRLMRQNHPDLGRTSEDIKIREEKCKRLNEAFRLINEGFRIKERRVSASFTHIDLFNFSVT